LFFVISDRCPDLLTNTDIFIKQLNDVVAINAIMHYTLLLSLELEHLRGKEYLLEKKAFKKWGLYHMPVLRRSELLITMRGLIVPLKE